MRSISGYGRTGVWLVAVAMMPALATMLTACRRASAGTCEVSAVVTPGAWGVEQDKGSKGPCDYKEDCGNIVREEG